MLNHVIWFKKNLRVVDNATLLDSKYPKILIYIIEPQLWVQKDMSLRQWEFTLESLKDLRNQLSSINLHLNILSGDALEVFKDIHLKYGIKKVTSEQETGINWTYQRDKRIGQFFKSEKIAWQEIPHTGVIRGRHNRDNWAKNFHKEINKPILSTNEYFKSSKILEIPNFQHPQEFYDSTPCPERQKGGSVNAKKLLQTFLDFRGENYQKEMSSPISAEQSCSRLSTHFVFGTMSTRVAFHEASHRQKELQGTNKNFVRSINSFLSRLHWRSHFIQKLEDEPSIEEKNFISIYDNLRDEDEIKLKAWIEGRTGIPFIDACMIYLRNHGWINFRMRAMLASFAAYNLWLDWRFYAPHLAALFTDFEPGIHYSQVQMQSGTTGINAIRVYNPYKQSEDQDPKGLFIRKNIPKFQEVPLNLLHYPENITPFEEQLLPNNWIKPMVNVNQTSKFAKDRIFSLRKMTNHKMLAKSVYIKHGSRK